MLGYPVDANVLNQKFAQTALNLRAAFSDVYTVGKWLTNNPVANDVDPLVEQYGFTADEAYAVRVYFETFDKIRADNQPTFDIGRKMTGLM